MPSNPFARRSKALELMDTESYSFEDFQAYLAELERINAWVLAYRPTLRWLTQVLSCIRREGPVTILDVGSGNGDMLRQILTWAGRRGVIVELTGVDSNPWSKKSAELTTPPGAPIRFETADIFDFEPACAFDCVISSHFTHHLTDDDNVRFLHWMDDHARLGWFINDLHRHPVPYGVIKYATRIFGGNPSVRHDGPLSVARAFTAADWRSLLSRAGIPASQTEIRWFFPFRCCVARRKPACP